MEYNTTRKKLVIPQYGRNIQKLIDYTIAIEDKEKRKELAYMIINIMGQINPETNNNSTTDTKQKLWDHLFIISDFKLDIDAPYPPPSKEVLYTKPEKLPYHTNNIEFRHYGKNIVKMIEKATEYEEGPEKEALVKAIANHLKKSYLHWNRDSVNDNLITDHLAQLSENKLKLDDDYTLKSTSEILSQRRKKRFVSKQKDGYSPRSRDSRDRIKRERKKQ